MKKHILSKYARTTEIIRSRKDEDPTMETFDSGESSDTDGFYLNEGPTLITESRETSDPDWFFVLT